MNAHEVLIRPLLSEKTMSDREANNKYAFVVNTKASKTDIRSAVESLFEVKVVSVATNVTRGKLKRRGAHVSLRPKKKKAIVALAEGQRLSLFDDE